MFKCIIEETLKAWYGEDFQSYSQSDGTMECCAS